MNDTDMNVLIRRCHSKIRFAKRKKGRDYASMRSKMFNKEYDIYYCDNCSGYHLSVTIRDKMKKEIK